MMGQFVKYTCIIQIIFNFILSQNYVPSNKFTIPKNRILREIFYFSKNYEFANPEFFRSKSKEKFNISLNFDYAFNSGHSNIDNTSNFFAAGKFNIMRSFRFEYSNTWLNLELEPYTISREDVFNGYSSHNSFMYLNNNTNPSFKYEANELGLKNSRILLHHKGLGISYGKVNHWWGEGIHSSLSLTSNSPSQETYSVGTFKDIAIGNLKIYTNFILMPFKNYNREQIYYSGMRMKISIHSEPIISLGINRSYMSGDLSNLNNLSSLNNSWSAMDAFKLLFEPLFGQDKKNLEYVIPNTPGFDIWDEIISANLKLIFPKDNVEFYLEFSSDDSRANITDLFAHWDHTLGYLIGFKKFFLSNRKTYLLGFEYLSTKPSNTFKDSFYRGDGNEINYFTRYSFNHFTYNGRFMGPHSGSSSDDLLFLLGFNNEKLTTIFYFNIERHGLKSFDNPQYKRESYLLLNYHINKQNNFSVNFEFEKIENFGFEKDHISRSNLIWFGYSHYFNWQQ